MKIAMRILAIITITLVVLATAGYVALKHGIDIDELSLRSIQISRLHLDLQEKLNLDIAEIKIQPPAKQARVTPDSATVRRLLQVANYLQTWFTSIRIDQVSAGPLTGRFHFDSNSGGRLDLRSPLAELNAVIRLADEQVLVEIEKLSVSRYQSHASGTVQIDAAGETLDAILDVMVADTLPVQLNLHADTGKLTFSGKGINAIDDIKPVVDLFGLDPGITAWIYGNLHGNRISLYSISGTIPYDDPPAILQTLHAVARIEEAQYTFAQGLEPIKAQETEVEFEQGVLRIRPQAASFYGQDTGDSHLDINFNDGKYILTAYIRTRAQASGGVLALLEHYGIPLPFTQKKGLTGTDLTLVIDLADGHVGAKGTFRSEDSVFQYNEQEIDVTRLDIALHDSVVSIHELDINRKDHFSAHINGVMDAAKHTGDFTCTIDKFTYRSTHAQVHLIRPDGQPLLVKYHMNPEGDSARISASSWQAGESRIDIGAFTAPIDHKTWTGTLPPTPVEILPWIKSSVSGKFSRKTPYARLDVRLLDLNQTALRLAQPEARLDVTVGEHIEVATDKPIELSAGDTAVKLQPGRVSYGNGRLHIHDSGITIGEYFSTDLNGSVDFDHRTAELFLHRTKLNNAGGDELFAINEPVPVKLSSKESGIRVSIPEMDLEYSRQADQSWLVMLDDLGKLQAHSAWMKDDGLQTGSIRLSSPDGAYPWSPGGRLTLAGTGFNDAFLNKLYPQAEFEKGMVEFHVTGNLHHVVGVLRVEDTTIKDLKVLNNMLAFVNTIPALLNFKVPEYSLKGLPVNEIYMGFDYDEGLIKVKSLKLQSSELDIQGEGKVNINDGTVDMIFNLITGTKKNIGKIPLLGYVLAGSEKKPSITLTVKGDIKDPVVSNTAFREVSTYPFQVLKRTIVLPGHLVEEVRKKQKTTSDDGHDDVTETPE